MNLSTPAAVNPAAGFAPQSLPEWDDEPGVFEVPVLVMGSHLLIAIAETPDGPAGIALRFVEPGGDMDAATAALYQAIEDHGA